ncbi:protein of unknown function [Nakamurella panacisegetis]|uniref:eCIS core domain-containing protein n=1 Tax=Nakamurella panacisegetis TaxID=1090615 RepID=A0A1H0T7L8_9ACTN|nr:DUF4157 domain-containing protein [Nakamurella panacisegetis]SDP50043.1 protein of unknown function [Nakamurella panacisegetis]
MHDHDHERAGSALRPKASRIEPEPSSPMWQAAGQGRPDVLGPAGLMGLQRMVGNAGVGSVLEPDASPVHDVLSSGGAPLASDVRSDMEAALGHDFSDVRVHTDGAAHQSARAVNAQAYTVGHDVVFQQGRYEPSSEAGRHMLAHELTHVVQQRNGPVEGTDSGNGVRVSDPGDRFEREAAATADAAMSGPVTAGGPTTVPGAGAAVQREEVTEEDEVQTYVQREDETEEVES